MSENKKKDYGSAAMVIVALLAVILITHFFPVIERKLFTVEFPDYREQVILNVENVKVTPAPNAGFYVNVIGAIDNQSDYEWDRVNLILTSKDSQGKLDIVKRASIYHAVPEKTISPFTAEFFFDEKPQDINNFDIEITGARNPPPSVSVY